MNEKYKKNRNIIIISVIILTIILLFICANIIITKVLLSSNIINTIESPNAQYIAYVAEVDAGATTKYSYRLIILRKGQKFGKSRGIAYISYYKFDVKWIDNNTLIVNNPSYLDIFKQKTQIGDIKIKYKFMKKEK